MLNRAARAISGSPPLRTGAVSARTPQDRERHAQMAGAADGRGTIAGGNRAGAQAAGANTATRVAAGPAAALGGSTHRGRPGAHRRKLAARRSVPLGLAQILRRSWRQQLLRLAVDQPGVAHEKRGNTPAWV